MSTEIVSNLTSNSCPKCNKGILEVKEKKMYAKYKDSIVSYDLFGAWCNYCEALYILKKEDPVLYRKFISKII